MRDIKSPILKKFIDTYRYIYQYPDALQFNKSEWKDIANDSTWYDLTTVTVPKGYKGVLKTFYIDLRTGDDNGELSYRILKNGSPLLDYEKVDKFFIFLPSYPLNTILRYMGGDITIPLEENDLIQLQLSVAVSYGISATIQSGLKGWYWKI